MTNTTDGALSLLASMPEELRIATCGHVLRVLTYKAAAASSSPGPRSEKMHALGIAGSPLVFAAETSQGCVVPG